MLALGMPPNRGILLAVPPSSSARRRQMAGLRDGADLRSAHGVHQPRDHRRRRAAELGGALGATWPVRGTVAYRLSTRIVQMDHAPRVANR
jgi:hypothetical protein